jgi:selenocysteine-specific elongation factor
VQELIDERLVVREGSVLRSSDYKIALPDGDRHLAEDITTALSRDPLSPPDARQIATAVGADVKRIIAVMRALERQQRLVSVTPDLYFLRETVDRVREELIRELSGSSEMTTAQFRDRHKTSRKYAIPLLEYFDRSGVTVRIGEVRRLRNPKTARERV